MEPANTVHGKIALDFASALVNGDFYSAHNLLSKSQKNEWSFNSLKEEYEKMIDYGGGPIIHVEVVNEMEDWPAKGESDLGWAYVAMSGDGFSEAVAVIVCNDNDQPKIREIEWGRP